VREEREGETVREEKAGRRCRDREERWRYRFGDTRCYVIERIRCFVSALREASDAVIMPLYCCLRYVSGYVVSEECRCLIAEEVTVTEPREEATLSGIERATRDDTRRYTITLPLLLRDNIDSAMLRQYQKIRCVTRAEIAARDSDNAMLHERVDVV